MLSMIGAWLKEFRLLFLLFAVVPLAIGSIVAYDYYPGQFSWTYCLLSLAAIVLLHAGTIAFNDYFDFTSGADVNNKERTPFTGGTGLLVDGILKPSHVLIAGSACFAICIAIGMFIVLTRSPIVLLFGMVGVGLGALYTAPPLRLAYRLLGEITWLLSFPLTALGALFVLAPPYSIDGLMAMQPAIVVATVVSMPIAVLATVGFLILEFPDYNADRAARKIGVAVLIGRRAATVLVGALSLLSFALAILPVALGYISPAGLLSLVVVPVFVWVCHGLVKFSETPTRLVPYIAVGAISIYLFSAILAISLAIA